MNDFEEPIFDDDEFGEYTEPEGNQEPPQEPSNTEEDDLITEVLRLKGISDLEKIKFEDESAAVVERSWNSLSRNEQLNILLGDEEKQDDLAEDEIELLNAIRNSGKSVNEYLESLIPAEEPIVSYKVDSLTDEEVYALDLLEKVGAENITDEELDQAINNAKQNETLFKKTVEGLRKEFIRLQQDEEAQLANEKAAKQEAAYKEFATSIQNEIQSLNSFAGSELELSREDAEELASFMLELDDNGVSAFGRALQDPALFTKAAFWLLNEDQIVEELTKQMQETYKRGFEAGKLDTSKLSKLVTKTVEKPQQKEDIFFDDEDW